MIVLSALVGLIIGALFIRRPVYAISAIVAARVLIPIVANDFLMSGSPLGSAFHVSSLWIFITFAFAIIGKPRTLEVAVSSHPLGWSLIALFLAIGTATTIALAPPSVLASFVSTVCAPIVFGLLVASCVFRDARNRIQLARVLVFLASTQAVFIVLQVLSGSSIVWEAERLARQHWFTTPVINRPFGTMDNPIEAAVFIACTIPLLLLAVRSLAPRLMLLFLALASVALTESRLATVAAVVCASYVLWKSSTSLGSFLAAWAMVCAAVFILFPLVSRDVAQRFGSLLTGTDESASVRDSAWNYVQANWGDYLSVGGGYRTGSSVDGSYLESSLENSYLIYGFDFGFVALAIYICALLAIGFTGRAPECSVRVALVAALALAAGFSGFANPSAFGPIIWMMIAMSSSILPSAKMNARSVRVSSSSAARYRY